MAIWRALLLTASLALFSLGHAATTTDASSTATISSTTTATARRINVGITFTKAGANQNLINKFKLCVSSLLKYATVDINFYIIGDAQSQLIARRIFDKIQHVNVNYEVSSLVLFSSLYDIATLFEL
jgi:hypothetical protein